MKYSGKAKDSIKIDVVLQPTTDSLFAAKKEHREGFYEPLYDLGLLEQGLWDWLLQYGLACSFLMKIQFMIIDNI